MATPPGLALVTRISYDTIQYFVPVEERDIDRGTIATGSRDKMNRTELQPPSVSRTGRVVNVLQERIANQEISPGARLQEAELASEFSASRTVIREALSSLEQRGLVLRIPNRGAVVKKLEAKEVHEIFEIREWLEAMLTYQATINAPEGHWKPFIEEFVRDLKDKIEDGNIESYNETLERLRSETVRLSQNKTAGQFIGLILDRARMIKTRITLLPGRAEAGRKMHVDMLICMDKRDPEGAQRIKREIIRSAREAFHKYQSLVI